MNKNEEGKKLCLEEKAMYDTEIRLLYSLLKCGKESFYDWR